MSSAPAWLWVVFTLVAATAQTFRNFAQASLTASLGTVGATHIRFLFGLPFAILMFVPVWLVLGDIPAPNPAFLAWTSFGALAQVAGTALMLAAMRQRSFVVTTAYIKTEPVLVAIFSVLVLGHALGFGLAAAVLLATAGVLVMSWPSKAGGEILSWQPAAYGIAGGALFAMAAVGYAGALHALGEGPYFQAAMLMLVVALALQSIAMTAWLAVRQRDVLMAILRAWKPSIVAGFLGAFASLMWFSALALAGPTRVRTLALVEVLIAGVLSHRLLAQAPTLRDIIGIVLVVVGIILLLNG